MYPKHVTILIHRACGKGWLHVLNTHLYKMVIITCMYRIYGMPSLLRHKNFVVYTLMLTLFLDIENITVYSVKKIKIVFVRCYLSCSTNTTNCYNNLPQLKKYFENIVIFCYIYFPLPRLWHASGHTIKVMTCMCARA